MEKQLQLVSFEQAERLKQAGFDWRTEYFFSKNTKTFEPQLNHNYCGVSHDSNCGKKTEQSAPTVALALKWMKDVKKMVYTITAHVDEDGELECYTFKFGCYYPFPNSYETYEEAESALLDALLEELRIKRENF